MKVPFSSLLKGSSGPKGEKGDQGGPGKQGPEVSDLVCMCVQGCDCAQWMVVVVELKMRWPTVAMNCY